MINVKETNINSILVELNKENGSNYKLKVLEKYKDDELLKRVLKMTHDNVAFTYGLTMKNVKYCPEAIYSTGSGITLSEALDFLEFKLNTRELTGLAAIYGTGLMLDSLSAEDASVIIKIIGRDLKTNVGRTQITKIHPELLTRVNYMRCGVYNSKTKNDIKFPAIVQLKADGTYREFYVQNGEVTARSRSAEVYEYPTISEIMKTFPDGVYCGELTVSGITDRSEGNGLINSDDVPHDKLILELWDYVTNDEYKLAGKRDKKLKNTISYYNRFESLKNILKDVSDQVKLIPYKLVDTLKEALEQTSEWMNAGFEGSILKDFSGVFTDGTSKFQLKLKLEIDTEMRILGFQEGTKGSKRDGKVGAIIFGNDEETIKGKCSGFSDDELNEFTRRPEDFLNKIITVKFNDLSKARGNEHYALSHPRFVEIRNDKDETDTLEKVLDLRQMAMELK